MKDSSHAHLSLAFTFVLSVEQILSFVSLSSLTELFKEESKQIRRGENVAGSHHVESILFLALTRHISVSYITEILLTLVRKSGGKIFNHNLLVEKPELN